MTMALIENDNYGIEEGFVYNQHTGEWLCYRKGNGGAATASSYLELMGVDMVGWCRRSGK